MGFSFLNAQAYHPRTHEPWVWSSSRRRAWAWLLAAVSLAGLVGCNNAAPPGPSQPGEAVEQRPREALSTQWVRASEARAPTVILLHGYGARGDDLLPLARRLAERTPYHYVVAEAPIALPRGGRAWWPIDFRAREAQFGKGEGLDLRKQAPAELPEARARVSALMDHVKKRVGISEREVALVGFSQGAMLSLDSALHMQAAPACVGFLSGTYLDEADWRRRFAARRGMPVFMSHGTQDTILPYPLSEVLRDALEAQGVAVTFVRFEGGHTIPEAVVDALQAFLVRCLPAETAGSRGA